MLKYSYDKMEVAKVKKVIVISSTPRRNGNSEVLAKTFAQGAIDAGHNVEVIELKDYHLN